MSDFFKKFLLEDSRRWSPGGRFVALAAFGKHPGWDDHVEDLGLETESLNFAKRILYVDGIGGQIDSGAWEKLPPEQKLEAFKHVFVWQRSGQILVGRLWSSSDGKGRKRYPMVVCVHFTGVPLDWAVKQALPALAEIEVECAQATSAEQVRALLNRKRAGLRESIQSSDGRGEYAPLSNEMLSRILGPSADPKREGFLRVLYQLQSQIAPFAAPANVAAVRPQQIRVPSVGTGAESTLVFWSRFLLTQIDASVPLLITLPLEENWADITVGEPQSHEFFSLRASPKSVPLVSEVPYNLDAAFRAKANAFLDGFQKGELNGPDLKLAPEPILAGVEAEKSGWKKWLVVGIFIVLAGVAGVMLMLNAPAPAKRATAASTNLVAVAEPTPTNHPVAVSNAAPANPVPSTPDDTEARLAREKREAEELAAAKLKAEAEALKLREAEQAEAARIEREREAARIAADEQRKADEAARLKAEADAKADAEAAARASAPTASVVSTVVSTASTNSTVAAAPGPDATVMTNSIGMVLVKLPSGLWVGKCEVTQAEYRKVMGDNPSRSVNDLQPVERVSWNDAVEFARRLTEMEKEKLPAGRIYTLPTATQWAEFSAGQRFEDMPSGSAARTGPSPVGQSSPPNRFGLYDVLGNVWEWCLDNAIGEEKLLKGGAFNSSNYDRTLLPDRQVSNCGFRCVLAAQ